MQLHEDIGQLKETILLLCKYPSNIKLVDSVQEIVEKTNIETIYDRDASLLIDIIKNIIKAIRLGIENEGTLINLCMQEGSNDVVKDILNRMSADIPDDRVKLMLDLYSIIIHNKPLLDDIDKIIEYGMELKKSGNGVLKKIENIKNIRDTISQTQDRLEKTANSKFVEELLVTGDMNTSIGIGKLKKDRRLENSFRLKFNDLFNRLLGGGAKLRKTYTVMSRSQGFKSGTLTNLIHYAKDNPENVIPEEFLEGLKPLILYITHENTVLQTVRRHFKFEGYTDEEIDSWDEELYDIKLMNILAPKACNNIHLAIVALPSKSIFVKDIERMVEEYKRSGFKVIMLVEDYTKHIATKLDQTEQNMLPGDKIAIELNDLTKKIYAPIFTAVQLNREGVKEIKHRMRTNPDYAKDIHEGYMADSYNAFQSYEIVFFVDRGVIEGTDIEYFVAHSKKDRDNEKRKKNKGDNKYKDNGYIVAKFADDVGFRIENDNNYTSLSELNPHSNKAIIDTFNTVSAKMREKQLLEEALENSKNILLDNSIDPSTMSDIDIIEQAKMYV